MYDRLVVQSVKTTAVPPKIMTMIVPDAGLLPSPDLMPLEGSTRQVK